MMRSALIFARVLYVPVAAVVAAFLHDLIYDLITDRIGFVDVIDPRGYLHFAEQAVGHTVAAIGIAVAIAPPAFLLFGASARFVAVFSTLPLLFQIMSSDPFHGLTSGYFGPVYGFMIVVLCIFAVVDGLAVYARRANSVVR